jgi:YVTN family beta-propeller protein
MALKSQSTLEYVMIYGWVILIIVIVAALLYSMGIFTPTAGVESTITGFAPLLVTTQSCGNGGMEILIANTLGYPVEILNATIVSATGLQQSSTGSINQTIGLNGQGTLVFYNSTCDNFGAFYSSIIYVWYSYSSGFGTQILKATGSVTGKAALQETVNFIEVGLPAGTQWYINYQGHTKSSTASQITFLFSGLSSFYAGNVSVNEVGYFPSLFTGDAENASTYYIDYIPVRDVYVANGGSSTVSVLDPLTSTLVTNISVSSNPISLSVTPDGKLVYISSHGSGSVIAINTSNNLIAANISVGVNPTGIATNLIGSTVYALTLGNGGLLLKINASTYSIISSTKIGGSPQALAISPDDSLLYVAEPGTNSLLVANASSMQAILSIPVGTYPDSVATSPDGRFVFVANNLSNTISVISSPSDRVIKNISVGTGPRALAASPNGKTLLVSNYYSNTISVINTTSFSVIKTVHVGANPTGIAILPDAAEIYVASFGSNLVSVMYSANYTIKTNITNLKNPMGIADAASSSI